MRHILAILFLLPTTAWSSSYLDCDVTKSKNISFRSFESKDRITVTVQGKPCHEGKLSVRIETASGSLIYEYESQFSNHTAVQWDDENMEDVAIDLIDGILNNSINNSSILPEIFKCEIQSNDCNPYEKNVVPITQYYKIREQEIPLLTLPTYYEGWASFIYDNVIKEVIKVYEGGV